MVQYTPESEIENQLITQLTSGISQWNYRGDIHTEAALWQNFFEILESNNLTCMIGM